ncbi:hypothetical protein JZ751_000509 [Albula glossodonta]|uniref:Uncharacterized protein n=1 Tax=Albula glossodonta TaxID=121402 RepID=A0A8T2PWJ8_9TELE|nr:hypothetical protein JZ751_000509 [Albula glossodonta]
MFMANGGKLEGFSRSPVVRRKENPVDTRQITTPPWGACLFDVGSPHACRGREEEEEREVACFRVELGRTFMAFANVSGDFCQAQHLAFVDK